MSRKPKSSATKKEAKVAGASSSSARKKREQDTPTTLVPKLRFPEFRKAKGWEERPLGDFLSESRVPGSKGNVAKKITVKLWGNGVFEKNDAIQGSINTQYFRRKAGQFIYSKLDFLNQAFGLIPPSLDNFESTVDLPCFDFADGLNPVFLLEYVKRKDFYERLGETADGSRKARRIHAETFLSFSIALPSPAEQQKIAECLNTVDEVIVAQARKLDALKTHKKGLMQQLFPREGETQPRLRFPEFQNAGEWEEKAFSELCDIKHGYAFESEFFSNEGDYVLLTPGNFYEEGGYRDRGEKQKYYAGEIPRDYVLTEGDMLIAMTEQAAGLLGSPILVPASHKFLHNQRLGLVTKKPGVAWLNEFFFHVLNSQSVRKAIHNTASGAKVRHTSPTKVGNVVVSVPTTTAEQQRIATCLTSLDALIAAQTQKHEALKTHKKGLMQQLFPSPEEVEA